MANEDNYYWANNAGGCYLTKELCCTKEEKYLKRILCDGWTPYNNGVNPYFFTGHSQKSSPISGRVACWIDIDGNGYQFISSQTHDIDYGGEIGFVSISLGFQYRDMSYADPTYFNMDGCYSGTGLGPLSWGKLATNVPVFNTQLEADEYILYGTGIENALNYEDVEIDPEETETYYCYNTSNTGVQINGQMTEPTQEHRYYSNIRVQCNRAPALYFKGTNYELGVKYPDVISWISADTATADLDNIEVSGFWQPPIIGHTTFYANMFQFASAKGYYLPDGTYTYGFRMNTNFKLFKSEADADYYIKTGDDDEEIDLPDYPDNPDAPDTGDPEPETDFGDGGFLSPFIQTYVMKQAAVQEVADAFYTNDTTLLDNIKKGLELFGASPFEAIVGLSAFPFDCKEILNTMHTDGVYFGSYKKTMTNDVWKVISIDDDYIDAGSVMINPIETVSGRKIPMYKNFEPYCSFHVYLPYVGWEKIQLEDYLGKNVNIRYYIDIYTRSGVCCLVADNVLQDYFPVSCIGVELPITGQNLSRYANDTLNALLTTAGATIAGAVGGSMIPGIGTVAGAVGGGMISAAAAGGKGIFDIAQKGKPKDHNLQKGSFSAGTGCYMPQYVYFRWDVHDIIEPEHLNELYGKPSSYSGELSNLSGFVKVETMKLNTSGMSDDIINEVTNLLSGGIYV